MRHVRGSGRAGAAIAIAAASLVACGDDGPLPPGAAPAAGSAIVEVGVFDNTFRPGSVRVAPGTEVRFVNRGRNDHNAVSVDGDGWGVAAADFGPGAEYVHVFDRPGTYHYYCSFHGTADFGMVGEIVVGETPGSA